MPDLTDYTQLWLSLQLVAAKGSKNAQLSSSIRLVAADLVKIFNGNVRWQATEMQIEEAAIVASGLAIIRVENEKFLADLADVIKHTLSQASPMDLVLLAKGSFYMRKFKHTGDLYATIHAHAMTNYKKFNE